VDKWLEMKAPARVAVLINQLRKAVDRCGAASFFHLCFPYLFLFLCVLICTFLT
jgi:hypothetical protein